MKLIAAAEEKRKTRRKKNPHKCGERIKMKILKFPSKSNLCVDIDSKVKQQILYIIYKLKLAGSSLLNKIGYPLIVSNIEVQDEIVGLKIKIEASKHWTKISIDNRDFYFSRITGKFSGTGCSTCH